MERLGSLAIHCDEVAAQVTGSLSASGLEVIRSFDLQSARQALRDPQGCPCLHHGTAECTCQYVVLLVKAERNPPLTLVVHGHDGHTHLWIDGSSATAAEIVRRAVGRLAVPAPAAGSG